MRLSSSPLAPRPVIRVTRAIAVLLPLGLIALGACGGDATTAPTPSQPVRDASTDVRPDAAPLVDVVEAGPVSVPEAGPDVGADTVDAAPPREAAVEAGSTCLAMPRCDDAPPDPGPKRSWNHTTSGIWAALGGANHRGRDMFYVPGETQWILGKFAYGVSDKDIKGEDVDIYLQRDCAGSWTKLATVKTSEDGDNATVEGVEDKGGQIFYAIPKAHELGLGRHRIHLVVAGDLTTADMIVEVVPRGTPIFVSDVDGTLTTKENEEFGAMLTGATPESNPDSPAALSLLAAKGYRPMYMTARPAFLDARTREFVRHHNYPMGIVHTTLTFTGATGNTAVEYKTQELAMLAGKGLVPTFGFGNKDSDATAYENGKISPKSNRVFFQYTDSAWGGRRIEAYTELLPEFSKLPQVSCP